MKTYETVIILDERKIQDEGKSFSEEFSSTISGAGGTMIKVTPLGRKQFARQIKKHKTGIFWDFIFAVKESVAAGLPDKYRLDERILRMQVLVYDRPEEPAQAQVGVARKVEMAEPLMSSIN